MSNLIALAHIVSPSGTKAGHEANLPVYSVTKYAGFVKSSEYFKKDVHSKDLSTYKVVRSGEFAYATIHLDEGSIGVAPEDCLISPMYTVFTIDHESAEADYLLCLLKSPFMLAKYALLGSGSVHRRKSISLKALSSLQVPLPPLDKQRRIARVLARSLRLANAMNIQAQGLRTLVADAVAEILDDQIDMVNLPDLLMRPLRNGISPSTRGKHEGIVLTLSAITGGTFRDSLHKTGLFDVPPLEKARVEEGSMLICRGSGNRDLVGVGAMATPTQSDFVFPDTMIEARFDPGIIRTELVPHLWNSEAVRGQIKNRAKTTNGTYKISQTDLREVRFPVPTLATQDRLVEFVRHAKAVHSRLRDRGALARDLYDSVQYRAFRGEL